MNIRLPSLLLIIECVILNINGRLFECHGENNCGCPTSAISQTRIIAGEKADLNIWNWIVSLKIGSNHICGGTLILSDVVITAAHCMKTAKDLSKLKVYGGSHYLSTPNQCRSVRNVHYLTGYNERSLIHDIAVLRLSAPFNMSDSRLAIICLPNKISSAYPPIGHSLVAAGWGATEPDSQIPSNSLLQVTLNSISSHLKNCEAIVRSKYSQFCAGVIGEEKGMNQVLVMKNTFRHILDNLIQIPVKAIVVDH